MGGVSVVREKFDVGMGVITPELYRISIILLTGLCLCLVDDTD